MESEKEHERINQRLNELYKEIELKNGKEAKEFIGKELMPRLIIELKKKLFDKDRVKLFIDVDETLLQIILGNIEREDFPYKIEENENKKYLIIQGNKSNYVNIRYNSVIPNFSSITEMLYKAWASGLMDRSPFSSGCRVSVVALSKM